MSCISDVSGAREVTHSGETLLQQLLVFVRQMTGDRLSQWTLQCHHVLYIRQGVLESWEKKKKKKTYVAIKKSQHSASAGGTNPVRLFFSYSTGHGLPPGYSDAHGFQASSTALVLLSCVRKAALTASRSTD